MSESVHFSHLQNHEDEPAHASTIDSLLGLTLSQYTGKTANSLYVKFDDADGVPPILRNTVISAIDRHAVTDRSGAVVRMLPAEATIASPNRSLPRDISEHEARLVLSYLQSRIEELKGGRDWSPQEILFRNSLAF